MESPIDRVFVRRLCYDVVIGGTNEVSIFK
jgi:hypothetical protein